MMDRKSHRCLLAVALAVLGASVLLAKKPNPQAKQLLARALRLTDFCSKGSEPFRLNADIKLFSMARDQREGTYSLLWLSPEKWREEISLNDFTQVRIRLGKTMWRLRSSPVSPYPLYGLEHALDLRSRLAPKPGERYSEVKSRKLNGEPADCFKVRHGARRGLELCFDPLSGVLLSMGGKANGTFFSDYEQWGSKLIPDSVTNFKNHISDLQFTVTLISSPGRLSPGAFIPPRGAVEMPR